MGSAERRKKANKWKFSEIHARAFRQTSAILAGEDEIPFVRSFPRCPSRAMTITSQMPTSGPRQ
jgi:hypothetical protein